MSTGLSIAIIVEIIGIFVMGIGIGVEIGTKAHWANIIITIGAIVIVFGTLISAKLL